MPEDNLRSLKSSRPQLLLSQPGKMRDLFADRQDVFRGVLWTIRDDRPKPLLIAPGLFGLCVLADARVRRTVKDFFVRYVQELAEPVEHVQRDVPATRLDAAPMFGGLMFGKSFLRHVCVQTDALLR